MEHTATYGLTQWSKSDRIQMEDFNSDNLKLEQALAGLATQAASAGNCKIVTGTYAGTGKYGSNASNTLTFEAVPLALGIQGKFWSTWTIAGAEAAYARYGDNNSNTLFMTWSGPTVRWYSPQSAEAQLNTSGETYTYVALLACR